MGESVDEIPFDVITRRLFKDIPIDVADIDGLSCVCNGVSLWRDTTEDVISGMLRDADCVMVPKGIDSVSEGTIWVLVVPTGCDCVGKLEDCGSLSMLCDIDTEVPLV